MPKILGGAGKRGDPGEGGAKKRRDFEGSWKRGGFHLMLGQGKQPHSITMSHSKSRDVIKRRLKDVLTNTHAYDDIQPLRGGKSKGQIVQGMLERWERKAEGQTIHQIDHSWMYFYNQCKTNEAANAYTQAATSMLDPNTFCYFPTHESRHLEIQDSQGNIIAYRFRIPSDVTQHLNQSASLIPHLRALPDQSSSSSSKVKVKDADSKRGSTIATRNWSLHKLYVPLPRYHTNLLEDWNRGAEKWLQFNEPVFRYLGHVGLRNINPRMFSKFQEAAKYMPQGQNPVCPPWFGVAINVNQTGPGQPHVDCNDSAFGYNVVVGFGGKWESDLILWQPHIKIEVVPGDAIFFLGRCFTHNAVLKTPATIPRHVIDLYTHHTLLAYAAKVKHTGDPRAQPSIVKKGVEANADLMDQDYHPRVTLSKEEEQFLHDELTDLLTKNV